MPWLLVVLLATSAAAATMKKTGHNPHSTLLQISGVGSTAFDPARFSSWHFDQRLPLIHAKPGGHCPDVRGNIYNANCVNNGETDWNCFFGGWDGVDSCHDSVSVSVTENSFATMNAHVPVIATGATHNLNNPSVIKTSPSHWLMVYTQENPQDSGMVNKPGISESKDGVSFSPAAGGQNYLDIKGYPYNWTRADVNGGNVLLQVTHFYLLVSVHNVYNSTLTHYNTLERPVAGE